MFPKKFRDFISYLTTFDRISLKLLFGTVSHPHFSEEAVDKDMHCLTKVTKLVPG